LLESENESRSTHLRRRREAWPIETSFAGATVGRIFDRGTAFDLIVKSDPTAGSEFERIADLPIETPNGAAVPIRALADVRRERRCAC
jgi:Cu/Ag efflux pump CusA